MSKRKKRKNKTNKKASAKNDRKVSTDQWRHIASGTSHQLFTSGWVANFVVGAALLLIGPLVGKLIKNPKFVILSAAAGLTILIWTVAIIAIRQAAADRRIEETPTEGLLTPANDPSPPVPPSCRIPVPEDALRVYLGDSLGFFTGPKAAIIRVAGEDLLAVERKGNRLAVNAKIYSRDGRIVAEIQENRFFINPNNYFRRERPNPSTLIVYDQEGSQVINIKYLNSTAISVTGKLFSRSRPPVIIEPERMSIAGSVFTRACLGGSATIINVS